MMPLGFTLGWLYFFLSKYHIEIAVDSRSVKIIRKIPLIERTLEIPTAQLQVTSIDKFWGRSISLADKSKPAGIPVTLGFGLSKEESEWLFKNFERLTKEGPLLNRM